MSHFSILFSIFCCVFLLFFNLHTTRFINVLVFFRTRAIHAYVSQARRLVWVILRRDIWMMSNMPERDNRSIPRWLGSRVKYSSGSGIVDRGARQISFRKIIGFRRILACSRRGRLPADSR